MTWKASANFTSHRSWTAMDFSCYYLFVSRTHLMRTNESLTGNMPKIVKSWNDFMEVNVGFIMTWGMSETKTRNWSAKFIPEHLHLTSASTHTVCSSYANNLFRVFRIQMTYLAYLREKNLKRPSSNSCPNGEVHVRPPFWSRQCKCWENRESRKPSQLTIIKNYREPLEER